MGKLFKKYGIIIVSAFFILIIIMLTLLSLLSVNKYKKEVVARETQIKNLETSLNNIGEIQKGYVVKQAVRAGEKITAEIIQEVDVPVKMGLNIATSEDDLLNKYFRVSLEEGSIITKSEVLNTKLDNTNRYFDLVIDESPIGIEVGDYIDVRITFPFGEDFIAIAHKKVEQINSGIMKVIMNESDIYAYQSMLIDKAIYAGTKIYAVEYIDAGAQQTAEVYYPLNKNLAELSSMNPNLLELVKQEMITKRNQVDSLMGGGTNSKDEKSLEKITAQIEQIRREIGRSMSDSQRELDRRLQAEKEAAKQNP